MSEVQRDLIGRLLEPDATRRLGNLWAGVRDIKHNGWFADMDWGVLLNQQYPPPVKPPIKTINNLGTPYNQALFATKGFNKYSHIFSKF